MVHVYPQLFLVLLYWFAAWGESMMAPDAHFKPLDSSAAEFKDFEVMNNYTENALVSSFSIVCFTCPKS
jgi:hypothetical protein